MPVVGCGTGDLAVARNALLRIAILWKGLSPASVCGKTIEGLAPLARRTPGPHYPVGRKPRRRAMATDCDILAVDY